MQFSHAPQLTIFVRLTGVSIAVDDPRDHLFSHDGNLHAHRLDFYAGQRLPDNDLPGPRPKADGED